ncbi:MAG: hypothetical protein JWM57_1506, partial [Phycisphaerales bacterium]|nr:hypothetical protein [Phycisphaerales bacterium]
PPLSQYASKTGGGASFSQNFFKGYNVWSLLGIKVGNRVNVCPTALANFQAPSWSASNDSVRNLYSYKYNWLVSGSETNPVVAPAVPHAMAMGGDPVNSIVAKPYRAVPNASETLLFADTAQLVAYQTDDKPGSDRGMPKIAVVPGLTTAIPGGDGSKHQFVRGLSPVHGRLLPANSTNSVLSDGMMAQQGVINVCYADYSVRAVTITQGLVLNTADPSLSPPVLTDAGANGSGHSGNQVYIPDTRLDPTVNP